MWNHLRDFKIARVWFEITSVRPKLYDRKSKHQFITQISKSQNSADTTRLQAERLNHSAKLPPVGWRLRFKRWLVRRNLIVKIHSFSSRFKSTSHLMQQDSAQQKRKAMIPTRLLYVTLVKTYESKVHVNVSIFYRSELLPSSYWWNWYHQWQPLGQRHLPQTTADK